MKSLFIVLALALICHTLSEKIRYDGYQLLRVDVSNSTDFDLLFRLSDKHSLDVWAANRIEGWADVMVPPGRLQHFNELFTAKVQIDNVQTTLDQHEDEMSRIVPNDVFDSFPTPVETIAFLNEQLQAHPDVATKFVMGHTYEGREIVGVILGNDDTKPKIFIHCTIHAREWITTTTCLWIIDSLLNTDPDGRSLIEDFQWFIVPILNVDGYDFTHTSNRLWRKSRSPNSGSTCLGTDLNRNFGYAWGGEGSSPNPCAETYRGTAAYSTPEIAAERDFLKPYMDSSELVLYMDIHSYGGQLASPWAYTYTLPPDYPQMSIIMRSAVAAIQAINGRTYAYGSSSEVIYISSGGSKDWVYGDSGIIPSFSIECAGTSFTPPVDWIRPMGREIYACMKDLANGLRNK